MKRVTTLLVALALGTLLAQSAFAANAVRISQQYGSGSGTGATYNRDYIELFNNSASPVNIGGWSIQYGAATGTVGFGGSAAQVSNIPANTMIAPCGYFLISIGTAGTIGAALPTPDLIGNTALNMSGTAGKVALISNQTAPTLCGGGGNSVGGAFVDVLGYGTANCFETAPAPATTATTAATRGGGGMTDIDNNSSDFTSVLPAPRNSASPKNTQCLITPANSSTWGQLKLHYR